MFRRLPQSLPPDTVVAPNLEELGYFINKQDQVRQIRDPSQKYQFRIDRNDRINEVHQEAMNTCMGSIVLERLLDNNLEILRLPLGATSEEKHIPILVSKDITTKNHVIVLFGDRVHDLGILSYRTMSEDGLNIGSVVDFVDDIMQIENGPGIIIANPAQLIWYRGQARAVSDREWLALPRKSAVHGAMNVDEVNNRVSGNEDFVQHTRYVFEHVMHGYCKQNSKFNIVGLEYTGSAATQYFANNWDGWKDQISCIALINPQYSLTELTAEVSNPAAFIDFVQQRTRAYFMSEMPENSIVPGKDRLGCNCYSSHEMLYDDKIFVRSWRLILDWFNEVNSTPDYSEPVFEESTWKGEDMDDV